MIEISRYPRLGPHGWQAKVTVGGVQRTVLRVGTRSQMEARAVEVECDMITSPLRSDTAEAARVRQDAVRRALHGAL